MVVVEAGTSFPDPGKDGPVALVRPEAMGLGAGRIRSRQDRTVNHAYPLNRG